MPTNRFQQPLLQADSRYREDKRIPAESNSWLNLLLLFCAGTCFGFAVWSLLVTLISQYLILGKSSNLQMHKPHPILKPPALNATNQTASSNKDLSSQHNPIFFNDIAGMDEVKFELQEVVDFLKNPEKFEKLGARMPKGVLLVGPPGSGKTMLARAVATESHTPYIYASGSEFVEIYVGQGAKRIRQLFEVARNKSPCIIFIDEVDAVGGRRSGRGSPSSQREHDQTLNQLLIEMDGFSSSAPIVVLAATNRVDSLDPALLRPGRFDRIVHISLPNVAERKLILEKHLQKVPHDIEEKSLLNLSKITQGFSGADLSNLVNEAALLAARSNQVSVTIENLNSARDKVSFGPERRSVIMSEEQRRLTAYHEAGHAVVAYFLQPNADPIHKASIVSRGSALGYVEQIPSDERHGYAKAQLHARLAVTMGGRAAEELVFGKEHISSGASSDIYVATSMAYKMVSDWGMSEKLGPLSYSLQKLPISSVPSQLSSNTMNLIESEVKLLIFNAMKQAVSILKKHRKQLDDVAFALLEDETLSGEQISAILSGKPWHTESNQPVDKLSQQSKEHLHSSAHLNNKISSSSSPTSSDTNSLPVSKLDTPKNQFSRMLKNSTESISPHMSHTRRCLFGQLCSWASNKIFWWPKNNRD